MSAPTWCPSCRAGTCGAHPRIQRWKCAHCNRHVSLTTPGGWSAMVNDLCLTDTHRGKHEWEKEKE